MLKSLDTLSLISMTAGIKSPVKPSSGSLCLLNSDHRLGSHQHWWLWQKLPLLFHECWVKVTELHWNSATHSRWILIYKLVIFFRHEKSKSKISTKTKSRDRIFSSDHIILCAIVSYFKNLYSTTACSNSSSAETVLCAMLNHALSTHIWRLYGIPIISKRSISKSTPMVAL